MSSPYTDRFGYPLTAAQAAARMNHSKRRGYYNAAGRWVRLSGTAKRAPAEPKKEPRTPSSGG